MLAPLLFIIFFAAVMNVAYTRFKVDGIMDALEHLRKKKGAGGWGKAIDRETNLATLFWGMLYADDVGVVSPYLEQLRKMMGESWSYTRRLASDPFNGWGGGAGL